jgi:tricorn protease
MIGRTLQFAAVLSLFVTGAFAQGQESIRFGRTPDISPDGRLVAFSYLGDIWVVETIGGVARPITLHEAHDIYPVFSPDGRSIAFSSNRNGSYDVFVVPVTGGRPRRLTFDSAADLVNGWSPDGQSVLFTSNRSTTFPPQTELYAVPVEGGAVRPITHAEGKDGVFSPKGDQIAYARGPGTWYRKGYRGSSNDDIWICDANGMNNRRVSDFNGQDGSPMWAAGGDSLYYVSEFYGTPANIVRQPLSKGAKPAQITFHKDEAVRRARISGDGKWIVYECGADLWVTPISGGAPRKLAIEVHADDKVNPDHTVTYTDGVSEFALSPRETHIAFVVHGQIFLTPVTGGKATLLTDCPANNHGISWSPDSRKILFASDRSGAEDLYILESDDPEHGDLLRAHTFRARQLTKGPEAEGQASYSPDGKLIAFLRGGKLCLMKPDGSGQKTLVQDVQVFDYEWSPDSKYIAYARRDGSFASDIYIIPAAGGEAKNVTRYATYNGGLSWSLRGKKISFVSERRRNELSLFVLSLQKPLAPGTFAGGDIDWEDIHLRVEQPVPFHVEEGAISPDGTKVAFGARSQSGDDLWVANTNGSQLSRLTTGNQQPREITWSRFVPDVVYFRDGKGAIRVARTAAMPETLRLMSGVADAGRIHFTAKLTIRRDEEFNEMFEQSWRALDEEFYDPAFHGSNWKEVREKYRPLVKHVSMKEDFYSLVNLMMGELNASHLAIVGPSTQPQEPTADLGLVFDENYHGQGGRVLEVLKRGPADRRGLNIKAGDTILAIDGVLLNNRVNLSRLLNSKVDEAVTLVVRSDAGDARSQRRVELIAGSREKTRELMYERWVENNARRVAAISHGTLGYIHLPSMDEAGLERFVRALYSDNFNKDAIVLDVRYNGGGFTHDQVLNYLGGRDHTFFRQRDGGQGGVMRSFDRKWSKPVVLLMNNRSYSDAEILPSAFRTLGLGKLVGQTTGNHVIGTYSVRLIDGSRFRVPHVGVYTSAGADMEKQGVEPDVVVEPQPDQLAQGIDTQLEKAVEVLQTDVVAWKRSHPSLAAGKSQEKPAAAITSSSGK